MSEKTNEQLLTYYRNRAAELEYQFLQFQIEASAKIEELEAALAESQPTEE